MLKEITATDADNWFMAQSEETRIAINRQMDEEWMAGDCQGTREGIQKRIIREKMLNGITTEAIRKGDIVQVRPDAELDTLRAFAGCLGTVQSDEDGEGRVIVCFCYPSMNKTGTSFCNERFPVAALRRIGRAPFLPDSAKWPRLLWEVNPTG